MYVCPSACQSYRLIRFVGSVIFMAFIEDRRLNLVKEILTFLELIIEIHSLKIVPCCHRNHYLRNEMNRIKQHRKIVVKKDKN